MKLGQRAGDVPANPQSMRDRTATTNTIAAQEWISFMVSINCAPPPGDEVTMNGLPIYAPVMLKAAMEVATVQWVRRTTLSQT